MIRNLVDQAYVKQTQPSVDWTLGLFLWEQTRISETKNRCSEITCWGNREWCSGFACKETTRRESSFGEKKSLQLSGRESGRRAKARTGWTAGKWATQVGGAVRPNRWLLVGFPDSQAENLSDRWRRQDRGDVCSGQEVVLVWQEVTRNCCGLLSALTTIYCLHSASDVGFNWV